MREESKRMDQRNGIKGGEKGFKDLIIGSTVFNSLLSSLFQESVNESINQAYKEVVKRNKGQGEEEREEREEDDKGGEEDEDLDKEEEEEKHWPWFDPVEVPPVPGIRMPEGFPEFIEMPEEMRTEGGFRNAEAREGINRH